MSESEDLTANNIDRQQLAFFENQRAGCAFAAAAARDPAKYGWRRRVIEVRRDLIHTLITSAIEDPVVSTMSLVFPSVLTSEDLVRLVTDVAAVPPVFLGQELVFHETVCLGLRIKVKNDISWVSGFGNFKFLPITRQAPFAEIVFRVKARPDYTVVIKQAPPGTIHLADMHMPGVARRTFERLWQSSLDHTAALLGQPPDLRSAAKTTFAIPADLWSRH